MSRLYNCVMGSVDGCPYAPRSKAIPWIPIVTAGANALGSIANTIFGSKSQESANETNLEIARMNNEQAYKMFKEQNAFNEDMWNKQNLYNDPSNQADRLKRAGINPAAVFGNGSVTPASQLMSAHAPSLQQGHVNPYQPNLGLGEAANAFVQSQLVNSQRAKLDAETKHTETLNLRDMKSMDSIIENLRNEAKGSGWKADLAKQELEYVQATQQARIQMQFSEAKIQNKNLEIMEQQLQNHIINNEIAKVQLAYAPKLSQAQLNQYWIAVRQAQAEIGLINANKTLTEAQRDHEIQKKVGTIIENGTKGLDYKLRAATQKCLIEQEKEKTFKMQTETRYFDIGPVRIQRRNASTNKVDNPIMGHYPD